MYHEMQRRATSRAAIPILILAHVFSAENPAPSSSNTQPGAQSPIVSAMLQKFAPHELISPEELNLPQPDGSSVSITRGPITPKLIELCAAAVGTDLDQQAMAGRLTRVGACYSSTLGVLIADPNIAIRQMSESVDGRWNSSKSRGHAAEKVQAVRPHGRWAAAEQATNVIREDPRIFQYPLCCCCRPCCAFCACVSAVSLSFLHGNSCMAEPLHTATHAHGLPTKYR